MLKRKCLVVSMGILGVVCLFSGCFFERVAWSPDGKSLVFTDRGSGQLRFWNLEDERCALLEPQVVKSDGTLGMVEKSIVSCRYMPDGKRLLFLTEESEGGLYLMDMGTRKAELVAGQVEMFFDVGADGRIFYILKDSEAKRSSLWERALDGSKRMVLTSAGDIAFPRPSPDGKSILYSAEKGGLRIFDTITSTTKPLPLEGIEVAFWPLWASEDRIVYCVKRGEKGAKSDEDIIGDLVVCDLRSGKTRTLLSDAVHLLYPISLTPDGESVALSAARMREGEEIDSERPDQWQIVMVNLATAEKTWVTDSVLGAISPAISPDGKRLAYYVMAGDEGVLEVRNLKTGETRVAWRNEMEHLYSQGDALLKRGMKRDAIAKWKMLTRAFPDDKMATSTWYRLLRLYSEEGEEGLDDAYDMLREMNVVPSDVLARVNQMLWRGSDRLATDPPVDWIQTYSTKQSRQASQFDTDAARDLRSVWVRAGKERLYVRVELESDQDLYGLRFQDIALLLDYDSPEKGRREITESTDWERGAERMVLVRHWYGDIEKGQYDMEIRDGKGEVLGRYLAFGFPKGENALFYSQAESSVGGSFVTYAISLNALGVRKGQKVQMQVCSFKGGTETDTETSRVARRDGVWVCDVADTFGQENSLERIEADQKKAGEGARPVIKGIAGEFTIE